MIIRGFVIVAMALVNCQVLAQAPTGSSFIPTDIQQLREALTTGSQQQGQLIEIPANLARSWLQESDQAAWTAIQQRKPTTIKLGTLLEQQELAAERLIDGIDPFAIYGANGELSTIRIRGVGVNPSTFAEATINEARERGESTRALTATDRNEPRSSLAQVLVNQIQIVATTICGMNVKPKQISISIDVFVLEGEATYETAALCEWLSG